MTEPAKPLIAFRVHLTDGSSRDVFAASALLAERKVRLKLPDAHIRKIKVIRERKSDAGH